MRTAIIAVSALIGMTACNKDNRQGAKDKASDAASSAAEEGRQTGRDIGQAADTAAGAVREESRQSARDIKEGAAKAKSGAGTAMDSVGSKSRQAADAMKTAMGKDEAKTASDKKLNEKFRNALGKSKTVPASEKNDVAAHTDHGKMQLTGTVSSAETKREIGRIADDVAGKSKVKDDMKVAERVGTGPAD